jgi:hypothetical protein
MSFLHVDSAKEDDPKLDTVVENSLDVNFTVGAIPAPSKSAITSEIIPNKSESALKEDEIKV